MRILSIRDLDSFRVRSLFGLFGVKRWNFIRVVILMRDYGVFSCICLFVIR